MGLAVFGSPGALVRHSTMLPDLGCLVGTFTERGIRFALPCAKVTCCPPNCAQAGSNGRSASKVVLGLGYVWYTAMDAPTAYWTRLVDHSDRIGVANTPGLDETVFAHTGAEWRLSRSTSVFDALGTHPRVHRGFDSLEIQCASKNPLRMAGMTRRYVPKS